MIIKTVPSLTTPYILGREYKSKTFPNRLCLLSICCYQSLYVSQWTDIMCFLKQNKRGQQACLLDY